MASKSAKGKRSKPPEAGVLASLPNTRPNRMGRPRASAQRTPASTPAPAAARARSAPKRPAAAARTPPAPTASSAVRRPEPDPPSPPREASPPSGTELVTTVVQAAGEVARIGLTVGGQVIKGALGRLPRP